MIECLYEVVEGKLLRYPVISVSETGVMTCKAPMGRFQTSPASSWYGRTPEEAYAKELADCQEGILALQQDIKEAKALLLRAPVVIAEQLDYKTKLLADLAKLKETLHEDSKKG